MKKELFDAVTFGVLGFAVASALWYRSAPSWSLLAVTSVALGIVLTTLLVGAKHDSTKAG